MLSPIKEKALNTKAKKSEEKKVKKLSRLNKQKYEHQIRQKNKKAQSNQEKLTWNKRQAKAVCFQIQPAYLCPAY